MAAIIGTIPGYPYDEVTFSFVDRQERNNNDLLKRAIKKFESNVLTKSMVEHYSSEERIAKLLLPDIDAGLLPRQLKINDEQLLFDYYDYYYDLKLVSEAFKAIIEQEAPGRHLFFPVEIVNQELKGIAHFYIMQIRQVVSAIASVINPDDPNYSVAQTNSLYKEKVADLTLWRDVHMRSKVFISDTIREALMDKNMKNCQVKCAFEEH